MKLCARAPKFDSISTAGSGYKITVNHEVKIRRANKKDVCTEIKPIHRMARVF